MAGHRLEVNDAVLAAATPAQRKACEAYVETGSIDKVAKKLGVHRSNAHKLIRRAQKNAALYSMGEEADKLRLQERTHHVRGTSTLRDSAGNTIMRWEKTQASHDRFLEVMREFAEGLNQETPKIPKIPKPKYKNFVDDMAIAYVIGDGHLGLRSWELETGENWNLERGIADHLAALHWLAKRTPRTGIGWLINVGDILHCNDTTEMTPKSKHKLDADSRFPLVARRCSVMLRTMIDLLAHKHEEVWVVNARGNHDPDAGWWMNFNLQTAYEKNPRIKVIHNEMKILHIEWGENFIPVYHGDGVNPKRMHEKLTSGRFRKIRGRCAHCHALSGHIHHETVKEIGEIKFETFNSLIPADQYHDEAAYGAFRSMNAIHYHKEYGRVGRTECPHQLARSIAETPDDRDFA